MRHIRNNYLDKYLHKHHLDLTIEMIKLNETATFATHTKIMCRKTGSLLVDIIIESIPDDEEILNLIKPVIRQRNLSELFY